MGWRTQHPSGALNPSHTHTRPLFSANFTKSASPPGRAGAHPAHYVLDSGLWHLTSKGARLPVGWRIQRPSDTLYPCQATPRPPVSAHPTTAPARPNGQSLARRAAHLFPDGVPSNKGRAKRDSRRDAKRHIPKTVSVFSTSQTCPHRDVRAENRFGFLDIAQDALLPISWHNLAPVA